MADVRNVPAPAPRRRCARTQPGQTSRLSLLLSIIPVVLAVTAAALLAAGTAAAAARPAVTLETSSTTVSAGASVSLGGTVTNARPGVRAVSILRRSGGRWKTAATPDIAEDGSFSSEVTAGKAGTVEFMAQYKAGGVKSRSAVLSVDVRRVPVTWSAASAGGWGTAAVAGDGTLWTWGANDRGQLGLGSADRDPHPVPSIVSTGTAWASVSAGEDHTLAVKTDGTLWAWGGDADGQLGLGEATTTVSTPSRVDGDADWTAVAAGRAFSLALKRDGSLWAWGANATGQLGQGDGRSRSAPARIGRDADWVAIAAGSNHGVALKKDGTLWAWGYNGTGQLGVGDTRSRPAPTQVIGDTTSWKAVACGGDFTMAVSTQGGLFGWGYNGDGQLGVGDTGERVVPARVGVREDWAAVACGAHHTLALKRDGTLWAFGWNGLGQLGAADTGQRSSPAQVGEERQWTGVTAGGASSLALKASGSLWSWGGNEAGCLGLGDTDPHDAPSLVGGTSAP